MILLGLTLVLSARANPLAEDAEIRAELLSSFHELTRPASEGGPGHVCLTPLVRRLTERWDLFSPAEKAEITAKLAPWATDLREAVRPRTAPPPPAGASPCFVWGGDYEVLTDPNDRFYVTWEPGAIDEDTAEDLLDALTEGYETEVGELGWRQPTGMSSYPMLVYVYDDDSAAGAYTTVEWCDDVGYTPYIVIGSGSFYGGSWYKDMAVHEFNHASQFGYTDQRGSINTNIDLWWWEATATWVQEYVYASNNWWSQYITGYTNAPYIALERSSQSDYTDFWHMYGMAIMAFYLDEHVGGHDLVQDTWKFAARSDERSLSFEEIMEGVDQDWEEVYLGFIANSVVMDFDESRYFGSVKTADEVDELPASGESSERKAPEGYGQNYILFEADAAEPGTRVAVSFDGEDGVDWYAMMVQTDGDAILDQWLLDLDDEAKGETEFEIDGNSEHYLIVSPATTSASGREYSWSAEAIEDEEPEEEPSEGEGETEEPEGEEGDGAFDPDTKASTCGCGTTGSAGAGLAWAVGALALARRRRRG